MEKKITITLEQRDVENALRLIYAIDRHAAWSKATMRTISLMLAYDKEQLPQDVSSLVSLADELQRASREDGYDRALSEGWC